MDRSKTSNLITEKKRSNVEESSIPERIRRHPPKITASSKENIVKLPKPGDIISCKLNSDESEWKKLWIVGKDGKATGKNMYKINVLYEEDNQDTFSL